MFSLGSNGAQCAAPHRIHSKNHMATDSVHTLVRMPASAGGESSSRSGRSRDPHHPSRKPSRQRTIAEARCLRARASDRSLHDPVRSLSECAGDPVREYAPTFDTPSRSRSWDGAVPGVVSRGADGTSLRHFRVLWQPWPGSNRPQSPWARRPCHVRRPLLRQPR
jgi:hypothetical protein